MKIMKRIKESEYFKMNVICTLLCLIPFIIGAIFYSRMPQVMAVHFDINNQPNGHASKAFALFGIPALLLVVQVLLSIFVEFDPKNRNTPRSMQLLCRMLIPILSVFVECVCIVYGFNKELDMSMMIYMLLGILFLVIGNLLPKCKYNYTIGIRIPTTLGNEENWNKTHRLAGFVWVIGSLLMLAFVFLKKYEFMMWVLVIMVLIPIVYSVVYAMKKKA